MSVVVKFWGVRGSIACPSPHYVQYGGNTSCIEVCGDQGHFILDAGTGLRPLGNDMARRGITRSIFLMTHTHWDHICGFPFFAPAYQPGGRFRVMAGHLSQNGGIRSVLASQMAQPTFPIPLGALHADMSYEDFQAGETLTGLYPGVVVRTAPLNHPNGATGYRIEMGGKSVVLITDTEHLPGSPDVNVLKLMQDADLVIYDSTYTDAEFPAKVGWGHSTWQEGVRLARQANAARLAIFHHDPDHDDAVMAEIEEQASQSWENAFVARDGMAVELD